LSHLPLHPSLALSIAAIREMVERALDKPLADAVERAAALRFAQHGLVVLCQALEDRSDWWLGAFREQAAFFEHAPDACLLTDATGIICEANAAAAELFCVASAEVLNRPLASFIAEEERAAFRNRVLDLAGDASGRSRRWRALLEPPGCAIELSVRPVSQPRRAITRLCWLARKVPEPVA
jgi:PAS domain S-box-containing protein